MAKASANQYPYVTFAESAAPSTPSTGLALIYVKTDGKLYLKDDAGTETDVALGAFSGARVTKSGNQTITTGTDTALTFDTETFDTDSYHDNATNNSRLTIPATGYYVVTGQAFFTPGTTGTRRNVNIKLGGSTSIARHTSYPSGGSHRIQVSTGPYSFTASQYVELEVYHDRGSDNDISSSETFFAIHRLA